MDAKRPRKTDRFLVESARKRVSPLVVTSAIGVVLFAAWVVTVFLPKPLPPPEWWEREVEPALGRLRGAEDRRDWDAALRSCAEAVELVETRRDDFAGRLAELRATRKEIEHRRALETEASADLASLRRKTAPLREAGLGADERYSRAFDLLVEANPRVERFSETRSADGLAAEVGFLRSIPPPRTAPRFPRAALHEALRRRDYAEAIRFVEGHLREGGEAADRRLADSQRLAIDSAANEEFARLKEQALSGAPSSGHARLCDARERFRGTAAEPEFEALMRRLASPR